MEHEGLMFSNEKLYTYTLMTFFISQPRASISGRDMTKVKLWRQKTKVISNTEVTVLTTDN